MKKFLFSTALLAFCALPISANQSVHINPQTLSAVQWQNVELSKNLKTTVSAQQNQAFTRDFAGTESPIVAYRIPANQGALTIEIDSNVIDDHVFIPSAVILDSNFNVAASYPSSAFKFKEERGILGNRFSTELNLTPVNGQDYIYLLIYTTEQDLGKTTVVPHPAKTYAKAMGNQPPAIDDIKVQHTRNGEIVVNVRNDQGTRFIGLDDILPTKKAKTTTAVGTAAAPMAANSSKAVNVPVDKDTEAYFNQAVTKALKSGDVNKAMNLVNEAEKLGLTSPRKIFLKQVSSK
ncbi:maltose operon protein [Cricetibacter osteomyelitidis]|uniref:Maltose operon protein n=1 Tax=Cricetibacter osteomyelitidis TaxID=1521931 RepID=A0A4R2SV64_9PAST|nr:maltose operon protein MalM [Cricetibacter osteomyelitidis]TCP93360.1 maltose operon protein [Cricetibacter osteomyelitidis]